MDTHRFDGKLSLIRSLLERDLLRVKQISREERLRLFRLLSSFLASYPKITPQAFNNLETIIRDSSSHLNYDPTNDLSSEDLLYLLAEKITSLEGEKRNDLLDLLIIELTEMSSGMCPQGRAYRLLQAVIVAMDLSS